MLEWLWLRKVVGPAFSKTDSRLCLCFRTPIQNVIEGIEEIVLKVQVSRDGEEQHIVKVNRALTCPLS